MFNLNKPVMCNLSFSDIVISVWADFELTPGINILCGSMSDLAGESLSLLGLEGDVLGHTEAPVLCEGQVGLLGVREFFSILQNPDGDVGWVEAAGVADQGVFLVVLSWVTAVQLNLGWS